MASNDRAAAIARLAELGAATAASAPAEEKVKRSGEEVFAGGDEARLLIRPAHLSYVRDGARYYVEANVGDVVTLTKSEAKRLDEAGATVDPDVDDEELEDTLNDGELTDDELRAKNAGELVAYVNEHPEEAERVRALELERPEDKQRSTVLKATEADESGSGEGSGE